MPTTVDPTLTPETAPGAPGAAPPPCTTCGAPMLADQDWCLECGTAAPGRLGRRPGGRTVAAVAAATLLLIFAAVVISYSALEGDASQDAGRAAGADATPIPGQVASVPDAPPTTTQAPPVTTPPASTASTPTSPLVPSVPSAPAVPTPVVPVTPTNATPSPPANTGSTPTKTTSTSTGPKTPTKVTLTPITLGADALQAYDPSKRIQKQGDPADAQDGNVKTAWSVTTPDDGFDMQVGLLIDLEKSRNVKEIDVATDTPGGRIEVYGAVGSAIPPDILDTRWEHAASVSKVDENVRFGNKKGDGVERIRLPGPGAKGSLFRYVLLWFTTPPTKGATVSVADVALKG